MDVRSVLQTRTLKNVIATIPGKSATEGSREVLIASKRDAWVYGAVESGGTAVLLEVATVLAEILRIGWAPKRTIRLASWAGEELGLVGSTQYGESNPSQISMNTMAYIQVKSIPTGSKFSPRSSPTLENIIANVAQSISLRPDFPLKSRINSTTVAFKRLGSGLC